VPNACLHLGPRRPVTRVDESEQNSNGGPRNPWPRSESGTNPSTRVSTAWAQLQSLSGPPPLTQDPNLDLALDRKSVRPHLLQCSCSLLPKWTSSHRLDQYSKAAAPIRVFSTCFVPLLLICPLALAAVVASTAKTLKMRSRADLETVKQLKQLPSQPHSFLSVERMFCQSTEVG